MRTREWAKETQNVLIIAFVVASRENIKELTSLGRR